MHPEYVTAVLNELAYSDTIFTSEYRYDRGVGCSIPAHDRK